MSRYTGVRTTGGGQLRAEREPGGGVQEAGRDRTGPSSRGGIKGPDLKLEMTSDVIFPLLTGLKVKWNGKRTERFKPVKTGSVKFSQLEKLDLFIYFLLKVEVEPGIKLKSKIIK